MRVAFIGLGLIGGSIARALRARPDADVARLVAWSPEGRGPARAREAGVVDVAAPGLAEALRGADLVILAAPPLATLELIDRIAGLPHGTLPDEATVTDVASTKAEVVARADAAGLRFVGGHPMAGREVTGFESAMAGLFVGRPWIVVPGGHASAIDVDRVETLALACGARPIAMSAAAHDAAAAAVSHAPLVLSAALVEAVAGAPGVEPPPGADAARALAASGWQGMARLAKGDPEMGAGILATNAPAVAACLRDLRDRLDAWIAELEADGGPDAGRVRTALEADRERAVAWEREEPG